jgi:hypothetical protein
MESADQDAGDQPLGPHAASLLATEHWSLIAERSLIWNEAQSRATMFLTVLSAAGVALALVANNSGFGSRTTTVALVLLSLVFLLGVAAYIRLVQLNAAEFLLVLAMNRLRRAYLSLEPGIERYLAPARTTTSMACSPPTWWIGRLGGHCTSSSWSARRPSSRRSMQRWPRQ